MWCEFCEDVEGFGLGGIQLVQMNLTQCIRWRACLECFSTRRVLASVRPMEEDRENEA